MVRGSEEASRKRSSNRPRSRSRQKSKRSAVTAEGVGQKLEDCMDRVDERLRICYDRTKGARNVMEDLAEQLRKFKDDVREKARKDADNTKSAMTDISELRQELEAIEKSMKDRASAGVIATPGVAGQLDDPRAQISMVASTVACNTDEISKLKCHSNVMIMGEGRPDLDALTQVDNLGQALEILAPSQGHSSILSATFDYLLLYYLESLKSLQRVANP